MLHLAEETRVFDFVIIGLMATKAFYKTWEILWLRGSTGESVTGTYLSELRSNDSVLMQEHNQRIFTKDYYF